jgi:hypothetical protein
MATTYDMVRVHEALELLELASTYDLVRIHEAVVLIEAAVAAGDPELQPMLGARYKKLRPFIGRLKRRG